MLAQLAERRIPYISILTNPDDRRRQRELRDARRRDPRRAGRGHRLRRPARHQADARPGPARKDSRPRSSCSITACSTRVVHRRDLKHDGRPAAAPHERQAGRRGVGVAPEPSVPRGARLPVRAHDRRIQVRARAHRGAAGGARRSAQRLRVVPRRRHEREGKRRARRSDALLRAKRTPRREVHVAAPRRFPRAHSWSTDARSTRTYVVEFIERWTPDVERTRRDVLRGHDGDGVRLSSRASERRRRGDRDGARRPPRLDERRSGRSSPASRRSASTTSSTSATTREAIAREKAGIFKRGRARGHRRDATATSRRCSPTRARSAGATAVRRRRATSARIGDVAVTAPGTTFTSRCARRARDGPHAAGRRASGVELRARAADARRRRCAVSRRRSTKRARGAARRRLPGRFHRVGRFIFDVAHNPDGARGAGRDADGGRPTAAGRGRCSAC